ncbi:UNVERIFIED_CONTAM: hypothetical protein PYX00_010781 [Menopon gallinae]|uniref:Uncharacterized protein n=1 Tax=Menopon gallinae TaxID=328185 RepID=A0AAW2HHB1_9NEOP
MSSAVKVVIPAFCFLLLLAGTHPQLYGPNRAQTISNIFQIPIQTLSAVSNVAQNTRPIGEIVQQRRRPVQVYRPQTRPVYTPQISRAARVAGLYPTSDGSFFRI